jgi:hypothetical protein
LSDLVTRSISGHLTERMQHHYSTVNAAEQRDALAKVDPTVRLPSVGPKWGGRWGRDLAKWGG